MARNNHAINSFVAGEVSGKFVGRSDIAQYNQSCEELLNVIVHPQGGAGSRGGTVWIKEVTRRNGDSLLATDEVRMIPFYGSDGTRWQLCITPYNPAVPSGHSSNDPLEWMAVGEVTANGSDTAYAGLATLSGSAAIYSTYYQMLGLDRLQYAQAGDTLMIVHPSYRPLRIVYNPVASTNMKFTIRPYPDTGEWNTSGFTTVTIPADADQTFRQMPYLSPVVQSSGNDYALNLARGTDTYYTISPGSGSTLTFNSTWVGKMFKFTRGTNVVVILVVTYTNSTTLRGIPIGGTNITVSTNADYGGATADHFYEEGAWSDHRGWPSTVCFFEGRLVMGGTRTSPDEIWMSQVNDILEMDYRGLVTDSGYTDPFVTSDAFSTTLKSTVLNSVRWLSPKKTITAGTQFEEFVVSGPSSAKTIGVDNINTSGETAVGSAPVQAVRVEAATIFVDRTRRALRELAYNFDENSLRASNLNILAEHMGKKSQLLGLGTEPAYLAFKSEGGIKQIARQALPLGIVWCVDQHGCLPAMTREREQQVTAWHYHQISGTVNSTRPFVESISVFQSGETRFSVISASLPTREPDELWLAVRRRVGEDDGVGGIVYANKTYIERMEPEWEQAAYDTYWLDSSTNEGSQRKLYGYSPVYMDCTSITDSTEQNGLGEDPGCIALASLPQGVGAQVDVLINGVYLGKKTITIDGLDLSEDIDDMGLIASYWVAMIGFGYTARIVPQCPEVPAQIGSSLGQPRRVHEIVVNFVRTCAAKIGRRSDQDEEVTPVDAMDDVVFKSGANQDDPIPLYTGDARVTFPNGYETRPRIVIESSIPLPMFVNSIIAKMVVYE